MSLRRCRSLLASSLIVLLTACGGGGGSGETTSPTLQAPPAAAAPIVQSPSEASLAVQAALSGGASIAAQDSNPGSLFAPTDPFGAQSGNVAWRGLTARGAREQPMAITNLGCADLFPPPCSGSVSYDTNIGDGGSSAVPAGSYVAFGFDALQFSAEGESFTINGGLRIDYLSAFDLDSTSFANLRFQLTSTDLGGSVGGESFGPENGVMLVEFDADGEATLTADGRSFSGLSGITVTDDDNYTIGAAVLRAAHWSNGSGHVIATYQAWSVANARPLAGSSVTISGVGSSVAITVSASSSSAVVYDVHIDVGSIVKRYTVTASYALDGTPSYAVIEVAAV